MNDTKHQAALCYIRVIADALQLRDWEFVLSRSPANAEARAEITVHRNKNEATIALGREWETLSPEQQRKTTVHELLHAHTSRLCRTMNRLATLHDSDVVAYVDRAFNEEEEIIIDTLARVLAPHLPLPMEVMA